MPYKPALAPAIICSCDERNNPGVPTTQNEFQYNTNECNSAEPETNKDPVEQEIEDKHPGVNLTRLNIEPGQTDRQEQEAQPYEEDASRPARNTSQRGLANRPMSRSRRKEERLGPPATPEMTFFDQTQYSRRLAIATWAQQVSASSYFNTTRQYDGLPCLDDRDPPSTENMLNNPEDSDGPGRGLSILPQPAHPPRVADNNPPVLTPMHVHSYPYPVVNEASPFYSGANRGPTEPPTESFPSSQLLRPYNPQEPHLIYPTPTQGLYVTSCNNPPYEYTLSQTAHENPELAFHHPVAFSETITTTRTASGDVTKMRRRQWVVVPTRYSPYPCQPRATHSAQYFSEME